MNTSKKCKNLAELQKKVEVGDKKIYIEKTLLFNRLIFMAERGEGIEHIFKFELTPLKETATKLEEDFSGHEGHTRIDYIM